MSQVVVIVVRDPDASNDIYVYGADQARIIDVDLGRADLRDAEEWTEWLSAMRAERAGIVDPRARHTFETIVDSAAASFHHSAPQWH